MSYRSLALMVPFWCALFAAGDVALAAPAAGSPITAPLETWTWVDFPDSQCLNGSATGIGVKLTQRSDRLFIFFEGGGACWDYSSCWENGKTANINGYTQANFEGGKPYGALPLFDRSNPRNPLADASYIYVPYCTGDLHGGDNVTTLTKGGQQKATHFTGYRNVTAFLNRIVPTFPSTSRVWLSGWSAGGYGATINWGHIQDAFGDDVRVDVIADSSPMIDPQAERWNTWRSAWNFQTPADCADCTGLPELLGHFAAKYDGDHRYSLLSYTTDAIVSSYWMITRQKFSSELTALTSSTFDPSGGLRYFLVKGSAHVLLGTDIASDGVQLYDWLGQQVSDDPAWVSVRP